MYILYKTDTQHSFGSRDVLGFSQFVEGIISLCLQQAEKENEKISDDDLYNLNHIKQTQGYEGEGEFDYEEIEEDVLI